VALPAIGIAVANLVALGLMIGYVGASHAYSVGLHTLFRDHLPAVVITLAATAILSVALGRTLDASRDLALILAFAIAADVAAALAVTFAIDEMRRVAEFAFPRAIFTETVGGLQLLAVAGGSAIGYVIGRRSEGSASTSDIRRP
jgi:hypothetical protein